MIGGATTKKDSSRRFKKGLIPNTLPVAPTHPLDLVSLKELKEVFATLALHLMDLMSKMPPGIWAKFLFRGFCRRLTTSSLSSTILSHSTINPVRNLQKAFNSQVFSSHRARTKRICWDPLSISLPPRKESKSQIRNLILEPWQHHLCFLSKSKVLRDVLLETLPKMWKSLRPMTTTNECAWIIVIIIL